MPDTDPPSPRRSPLRWLPVVVVILGLPWAIIAAVTFGFRHHARPADTPGTRRLREVGQALHRFAQDHGGGYPDTLDVLVRDGGMSPDLLVTPTIPPVPLAYLARGLSEQTATNGTVLAYEPPAANAGLGGAVLYADGTVDWFRARDLPDELKRGKPPAQPGAE